MREEKIQIASENYKNRGFSCSQAVFSAYAEDLGIDQETAFRLMQGFSAGIAGTQGICGAFSAAVMVISYYMSGKGMDNSTKPVNFKAIRTAAELFKEEYGSIICREILRGDSPKALMCAEKITDAVRIIETILDKQQNQIQE